VTVNFETLVGDFKRNIVIHVIELVSICILVCVCVYVSVYNTCIEVYFY